MTVTNSSAWDIGEPRAPRPAEEAWIDRLSSLQVLAAHGDLDAREQARLWVESDPEARRVWDTVAQACGSLTDQPGRTDPDGPTDTR